MNTKWVVRVSDAAGGIASSLLFIEAAEFLFLIYVWRVRTPAATSTSEEDAWIIGMSMMAVAAALLGAIPALVSLTIRKRWPSPRVFVALPAVSSLTHALLLNARWLTVPGIWMSEFLDGKSFTLWVGLLASLALTVIAMSWKRRAGMQRCGDS